MTWKPDPNLTIPIYQQILRHYEDSIISGELVPGTRLPSERELAATLGVNRSTVNSAYAELRASGLVKSVQGSGTHVSEDLWGLIPRRSPNWKDYIEGGLFLPNQPVAQRVRELYRDKTLINLASSELSDELIPEALLQRLLQRLKLGGALQYGEPQGDRELREAVSIHLRQQGIEAHPDQILITSGIQQAFNLITQCLLSPGDAVALERPSFLYSRTIFTASGLRLLPVAMDEHGMLPDELHKLHSHHKLRMIFTNPTYQHPTGTTLPLERRRRLLEIAEELRIPIIEDDPYSLLTFDGAPAPPPSLMALHGGGDFVLYLGTFSKIAAPGIRIGWLVGPKPVVSRLTLAKEQMDFGTSILAQRLVMAYLTAEERIPHLERVRSALTVRRDRMLNAVREYLPGLASWIVPEGGYYLWGKLQTPVKDSQFVEACVKHGVLVMPGTVYGAGPDYLRLVFARTADVELEEGVRRLAAALKDSLLIHHYV